jgi:hypothetical protein
MDRRQALKPVLTASASAWAAGASCIAAREARTIKNVNNKNQQTDRKRYEYNTGNRRYG